jgi:hypothetical protein
MTATAQPPVDLVALKRAAAPVVAWYERFVGGRPMPVGELERALVGVQALPPVGGRIGRALATVANAGRSGTTEDTVAAFELLRRTAGLRHLPATPAPGTARDKRRGRPKPWSQPPLPGMGEE